MDNKQAINLLFHIANNIDLITKDENDQEVLCAAIEKAIQALSKEEN